MSSIPILSFADISSIFSSPNSSSSIFLSRSILFKSTIVFLLLFCISWITSLSSLSSSLEASSTSSTRSAFSINFFDFSTPIFSTISSVFLIPAVSVSTSGIPFILIISSITSLVVPGICVTIALSSFRSEFRRVDFPTLGFPAITVFIPSFIFFPLS